MRVLFFTTCAPLVGDWGVIQRHCLCRIQELIGFDFVVYGDDFGVRDFCCVRGIENVVRMRTGRDLGVLSSGGVVMSDVLEDVGKRDWDVAVFLCADNFVVTEEGKITEGLDSIALRYGLDFSLLGRRFELMDYSFLLGREYASVSVGEFRSLVGGLNRLNYGVDIFVWGRDAFLKMRKDPFLIDGWFVDNMLFNAIKLATKNIYDSLGIIDTVHCKHPESSHRQEGSSKSVSDYNRELLLNLYGSNEVYDIVFGGFV